MLLSRVVPVFVALVVVVPAAAPAQAVVAAPATRPFGATIDAPAGWERESSCSPTEKKGPRKLRKLLDATYGRISSNIVRPCSASDSGHEEGRALDWMVNVRVAEQKVIAETFLGWLQAPDAFGNAAAMARRLGITYLIWNNSMWRTSTGSWTEYGGCAARNKRFTKFDTTCHRNHIHLSFSWDGALGRTSYYTGFVACPAPVSDPWVPAFLTPVSAVVPVAPVRVLRTRYGVGLANGPCRAHPDVRLDVPVLGVGGLPVAGVANVVLQVQVTKVDAPTQVRVWPGGTAEPLATALTADKGVPGTATVTVPVGTGGLVSLELTGGMGHVTVDVVGYTAGAFV